MHVSEDGDEVVVVEGHGERADVAGRFGVVLDFFEWFNNPKTAIFLDSIFDFDDLLSEGKVVGLGGIAGTRVGPVPGSLVDALTLVTLQVKGFEAGIGFACRLVDDLRRLHLHSHFVG